MRGYNKFLLAEQIILLLNSTFHVGVCYVIVYLCLTLAVPDILPRSFAPAIDVTVCLEHRSMCNVLYIFCVNLASVREAE